nr:Down syndrome cell adhesion molecule-like protein Dscam2 isoform X1 [Parasteatoda tepidariorum]
MNNVGSILSREVHVKGVINQRFSPQVYDDFVVRGNTAVLKCHLPTFVKEYVSVDSWIRNDDYVLKMADTRIRSHTVLFSGELLIHETQEKDAEWSYRCQTRHRLTGEMVVSISAGKITVTEPHASTLPRVTFSRLQVRTAEGSPAQLPCVAQGNPPPLYRWMKEISGVLSPVKEDGRVWLVKGTLNFRKVLRTDAGKYQCIVRNSIGERRIETSLIISAPLQVSLLLPNALLNTGQEATFTCNVSGYPVHTIAWMKDQKIIVPTNRIQLVSREVLLITSLRRDDRGMYQCFAYNDNDSAQGTVELKISDVPPTLVSMFPEQSVHPGSPISLKCVTTGNPPPKVTWYVDGGAVSRTGRVTFGDHITEHANVVSFLNISDTRVEDGGEYKCQVSNDVGSTFHSSRLNVYGLTFVRALPNITAIAGEELLIRCPYGGYPIKSIRWFKSGMLLPLNHRQKVTHGGSLSIQNVQRSADQGSYSCTVQGANGETASGTTSVSVVVSPVIDQHFFRESSTVDEEARTKLVCIVSKGDPPLRFHWLKNGLPFVAHGDITIQTTEDSSIMAFKRITSADRGHYSCVASNVASSTNATMQMIVNVPPRWTVEPTNASVVLGNTVWMDCSAVGFPSPSVLWKKLVFTENTAGDFTYVHSSPRAHRYNNGSLVISDAEESDAGNYLCQANNGIGAGLSKIVTLQVLVPPRFKDSFQSRSTREGTNATLKCDSSGHSPITITWRKDKRVLDEKSNKRYIVRIISKTHQTISELHIVNATRKDSGKYSCTAVSEIGMDESIIQFIVQGFPDAPSNVSVLNTTSRSVSLFWEITHNGNSHITGSIVQYQTISDSNWNGQTSQLIVSGSENSATLRALNPITLYFVRVIAENSVGQSLPSSVINVTTEEEAPSGSPKDVQVQSTGAQSIKVTWKPPPEEFQHGRIRGYYVGYRLPESLESYTLKQVENNEKEHHSTYITGLQPFTKYEIIVKAYNSAGTGPKSDKIIGQTLETAPPTSPTVQIDGTTSSSITVHWKKDSKEKSATPEYSLHYKSENEDWRIETLNNSIDYHTLKGLRCGTRYQLYMTASNSLGTGEPSTPVFIRTKGAAPMSPQETAFIHANVTSSNLILSAWKTSGCPIKHFIVQYRPKYQSQWISSSKKVQMPPDIYVLQNLVAEKEYDIMVTAVSDAGLTQGEYTVRTLSQQALAPTMNPAFGKRETDLPFYKNLALVVPVVVSSLITILLLFAIIVCFRKHLKDRRRRHECDNRKSYPDSLMMSDMSKEVKTKPTDFSHYTCPGKTDYAEPYACEELLSKQGSDGLFATIKRCPTRPIYMSSYKPGNESFCSSHVSSHECNPLPDPNKKEKWNNPPNHSKPVR